MGYRPWLFELAMSMGLKGFDVYNDEEDGQQTVIALIEADDRRIQRFLSAVNAKRPQIAIVGSIISGDYDGDVMPLRQTAAMNAYCQMNKAIPILQAIKDNTDKIKESTDIIPQMANNTEKIFNSTEKILKEVKGLREDQPEYAMQFRQLQANVEAIKEHLGMV